MPGSSLTPWLVESIVRLGACLSFAQVPALLAHFTGVTIGVETARRLTEAAGAAQITVETAAVADLERTLPDPPAGPPVQRLRVDGAMVPLVAGEWSEAKTLAVGTVTVAADGTATTRELSYFSRLTDAATFGRLATGETHRRGTATVGTVVAVVDGAPWCQGCLDLHRPDAVRILDFPHAVAHLGQVAEAICGAGTAAARDWLGRQARALRHGQEGQVLDELARLTARTDRGAEAQRVSGQSLHYLTVRQDQIRYQTYATAGYPLGSGGVESANKLVVEARLKGSGRHWARANVNPMLALRTTICSGRWDELWPGMWHQMRHEVRCRTTQRRQARRALTRPSPIPDTGHVACPPASRAPHARTKTIINGKPTADHPWRRSSPFPAKR